MFNIKNISKALATYGIFFIIPAIVFLYSILLKIAAGPYWLATNIDPAYQYLVNGIYLIKGYVPNHTDHPGTPLQILCAVVDWLLNIGHSSDEVVNRVLTSPEFYLQVVFVALSLLTFITSVVLAVFVFQRTKDKLAALLTQLPALSFLILKSWSTLEPILPVVANVDPEPMQMSILNLFNLCFFSVYFAKSARENYRTSILWGLIGGLGVATKITFFPLLIAPIIVLSWLNRTIFLAAFSASLLLWTLPIISKYAQVWGWIHSIIMHTGVHGAGTSGVIEIGSYLLNWKSIVVEQGVYILILLLTIGTFFWKMIGKKSDKGTFFLTAAVLGVIVEFAVVAKHPGSHYLLPGIGLFSAVIVFFYWQFSFQEGVGRRIIAGLIIMVVLLGAWNANEYRQQLQRFTKDILSFNRDIDIKYPGSIIIDYYRSSSPSAALFFGDGWNLSPRLGKELSNLYPDKYYFQIWGNSILDFNGRVWTDDLLTQGRTVLFRGDGNYDFSKSPFQVRLLDKGRYESVYLLTATNEKRSSMLMAGAMYFIQKGDYPKAMACALQARQMHYQPDSAPKTLIDLIRPYLQHQ